jgi:hypothetical protein
MAQTPLKEKLAYLGRLTAATVDHRGFSAFLIIHQN